MGTFLKGIDEVEQKTLKTKLHGSQWQMLEKFCEAQKVNLDELSTRVMLDFVKNSRFIKEFQRTYKA